MSVFHRLIGLAALLLTLASTGRALAAGACCSGASFATCSIRTSTACGFLGGDFQGDNTTCSPSPCALGACCVGLPNAPGGCVTTNQYQCVAVNVQFVGAGTSCAPNPCDLGACCAGAPNQPGVCIFTHQTQCASATDRFQGIGTTCSPNPCIGACCFGASCFLGTALDCQRADYRPGQTCGRDVCPRGSFNCATPPSLSIAGSAYTLLYPTIVPPPVETWSCAANVIDTQYFRFTAPWTGYYVFDTENSAPFGDTVLSVLDECNAGELACDDNGGTGNLSQIVLPMQFGQSVIVRRAKSNDLLAWDARVNVYPTQLYGACCNNATGQCTIHFNADSCPSGSAYLGDGSICAPVVCFISGACTTPTCGCSITPPDSCLAPNIYRGNGSTCAAFPCPPGNDDCANALLIDDITFYILNNVAATSSPGAWCALETGEPDLWFSFTPSTDGAFTITAAPDNLGYTPVVRAPSLAIYADCTGSPLACASIPWPNLDPAVITARLRAGTPYLIRVAGPPFSRGYLDLNIQPGPQLPAPPINDTCGAALPILQLPFFDTRQVISAAPDLDIACNHPSSANSEGGIWYAYTPAADIFIRADIGPDPNALLPEVVAMFTGTCSGTLTQVACGSSLLSASGAPVVAGQTYFFLIAGYNTFPIDRLSNNVSFHLEQAVPPPFNDACNSGPALLIDSTTMGSNVGASTEQISTCDPDPDGELDVWYKFIPPVNGNYTFNTIGTHLLGSGSIGGTTLAIFGDNTVGTGCGIARACDSSPPGSSLDVSISFDLHAGRTTQIRVAGTNRQTGAFVLHITGAPNNPGACCTGSTCAITAAADCTGRFTGPSMACNASGNTSTPCNFADFNQSGGPSSVQDIFDFLAAYFAADPRTDINASSVISVQDIFDFLAAYFAQ